MRNYNLKYQENINYNNYYNKITVQRGRQKMTWYNKRKICDAYVVGKREEEKEEGRKWDGGGQRGKEERVEKRKEKIGILSLSKYILGHLNLKATYCYQVLPRWPNISTDNRFQHCLTKQGLNDYRWKIYENGTSWGHLP